MKRRGRWGARGWWARRGWPARGEEGSALAEFVLVGVMVTVLFLAVLQLGIDLYLRNALAAAAADGARYGANADVVSAAAADSYATTVAHRLLGATPVVVAGGVEPVGGRAEVVVRLSARLPTAFGLLPALPVAAAGRALVEGAA